MPDMTQSEREEVYRSTRGYISNIGLVFCGECVDDLRYLAAGDAQERMRFTSEQWVPYNPGEGDDWCSKCDKTITHTHRGI